MHRVRLTTTTSTKRLMTTTGRVMQKDTTSVLGIPFQANDLHVPFIEQTVDKLIETESHLLHCVFGSLGSGLRNLDNGRGVDSFL